MEPRGLKLMRLALEEQNVAGTSKTFQFLAQMTAATNSQKAEENTENVKKYSATEADCINNPPKTCQSNENKIIVTNENESFLEQPNSFMPSEKIKVPVKLQSDSCVLQEVDPTKMDFNSFSNDQSNHVSEISQKEQHPNLKLRFKRVNCSSYKVGNSSDEDPFSADDSHEYIPPAEIGLSSSSDTDSGGRKHTSVYTDINENSGNLENDNENSIVNDDNTSAKKKGEKRQRKPEEWKNNKRKMLKNSGKSYLSSRGKIVEERKMGPPCKCRLSCATKVPEDARKILFQQYWSLSSFEKQRNFLGTCIEILQVQYRRVKMNSIQPRRPNCSFVFLQDEKKIQICKPFLMSTLGIKARSVRTVVEAKFSGIEATPDDNRGKHNHHSKLDEEVTESVRVHINSIPRIESHYVRSTNSREFIDGGLTIAEMHRNYESLRKLADKPSANYDAYSYIFNTEFNIGFHVPKKDQCDQCEAFKNSTGDDKLRLEESYKEHQKQKELSRQEKAKDIEKSKDSGSIQIVAIYGLQAVMPVPIGDSSAFFYHSKLNCYNFTITDTNTKITRCYFWHEGLGHRGAIEIGTCVLKYLKEIEQSHPNCDLIFYSDNCCGQQKNRFVMAMYLYAVTYLSIKSITHKFLIRGHTQNEGDTAHSVIEQNIKRARKSGPIYVPDQFVSLIRTAKKRGEPFKVNELTFSDFFDLKSLAEDMNFNAIKNLNGDQIKITQIKMVEFKKGANSYHYKLGYEDDWIEAPIRTRGRSINKKNSNSSNIVVLKQVYKAKIIISGRKKDDLIKMINTNIVPKYYENFFNNLY